MFSKRRRWLLFAAIVIVLVLAGAFFLLEVNAPSTSPNTIPDSPPEAASAQTSLPQVTGETINGETITLPDDFTGRYNLVAMSFTREQQQDAAGWLPFFQELSADYDDLAYYSVAALPDLSVLGRTGVMVGLGAGVREEEVRDASVVLFLEDQQRFLNAITLQSNDDLAIFIMTQAGGIRLTTFGTYAPATADDVRAALADLYE